MAKRKGDKAIPGDVLERAAESLRVLAHPHRLRIVELLARHDLTVGQLAERLGIPHCACSQHLNRMRAHGILRCRRDGKAAYYEVQDPNALSLIRCIKEHAT